MKTLKTLGLFITLTISQVAYSMTESDFSGLLKLDSIQEDGSRDEIKLLKKKEQLLKAILKNSDFIQFKDGTVIDFQSLEDRDFERPLKYDRSPEAILEKIQTIEGGGTGHGG